MIAVAVLAGSGAAGVAIWARERNIVPRVTRLTVAPVRGQEFAVGGVDRDATISPDGTSVVYVGAAGTQLFVRDLNRLEALPLKGLGDPRNPFISPDGKRIGFFDGTYALKKVSIGGGVPIAICAVGDAPRGASWGPDDTIVFATSNIGSGLSRVPASGALPSHSPRRTSQKANRIISGREFFRTPAQFCSRSSAPPGRRTWPSSMCRPGSGASSYEAAATRNTPAAVTWVYASEGGLRAIGFDLRHLETIGTPVSVLDRIVMTPSGAANFGISSTGTLVYVAGGPQAIQRTLVWGRPARR